ncbi:MAG: GNAT family N-acyltransferase [Pseudomonadales bacterium]|nr:GNAT family N-acyltransferase [Pseudomonadales bacterium]
MLTPVLDRLLGLAKLRRMYTQSGIAGLPSTQFATASLKHLQINIDGSDTLASRLPASGPVLVLANHPLGGLEGIALAGALSSRRPDVKLLVNTALSAVKELSPFFIYTNPLKKSARGNLSSIRACRRHLEEGGVLVLFPAGRVSYFQKEQNQITDHEWHRTAAQLAQLPDVQVIPLFIGGQNSTTFHLLGRIYYRFRLLLLIREMLNSQGRTITFRPGQIDTAKPPVDDLQLMTDHYRLLCYLHNPDNHQAWAKPAAKIMHPLQPRQPAALLAQEVDSLPVDQQLVHYKNFVVCHASQAQIPAIVTEIQRLREENFRSLDEGSGAPFDGDEFDQTYTHLFVFDKETSRIVGAYRMGQTDQLRQDSGNAGLYLSRMFDFSAEFVNQREPCLEMGRSFVAMDNQRSFHGLFLLFRGIGAFVCKYPRYKTLYGTVSLSTQYQPASVHLIQQALLNPQINTQTSGVKPKQPFSYPRVAEVERFLRQHPLTFQSLDWLVRQIEPDRKGVPILLKQYHQLGASFHSLGIDPNFAATPGLLLCVDLPAAPERALKRYLGDSWQSYVSS